jgi:hypothetical protein
MSILETIGLVWVIFTSTIATVAISYFAYVGLKATVLKATRDNSDVPVEVKEMFKIAR